MHSSKIILWIISTIFARGVHSSLSHLDTPESPFGLTFTPTTIIASRFNVSGGLAKTKAPLGLDYQKLYQNAVRLFNADTKEPYEDYDTSNISAAESIFHEAMTPITELLIKQLGHAPEYAALSWPPIFSYPLRDAAEHAAFGEWGQRPTATPYSQEAACYSYGFLGCKNLGREPEECVEGGPLNLVLVLECEKEYLYAWLKEVDFELEVHWTVYKDFCRDCGERFSEVS